MRDGRCRSPTLMASELTSVRMGVSASLPRFGGTDTDATGSPGCAPRPGTSLAAVGGAAYAELRSPSSSVQTAATAASGVGRWWPEAGGLKGIEAYQGPGPLPGS